MSKKKMAPAKRTDSPLIDRFRHARVAVIGDVMLDVHIVGQVNRISADAPVPVLLVQSERHALGGAANVAANIAALGGNALLIGLIGDDPAGHQLVEALAAAEGRIEQRFVSVQGRPTITKTRYLSGQHQIVRVDRERVEPPPKAAHDALIEEIEDAVATCDVVVLSDYGKGVLTDAVLAATFAAAKKSKRTVIVDPKRMNFAEYRGASIITPNRKELTTAVGLPCETDAQAEIAAKAAMDASGAAILLTRSEKGMTLYRDGQPNIHLPAEAREVFDVSGAGDTVVAGLALSLAAHLPHEQGVRVANAAAAVVVGKVGTATVSPHELSVAMRSQSRSGAEAQTPDEAVTPIGKALAQRDKWRAEGLVVGFTNGCFDLLHAGHVSLLSQSAAACDRLIVALNSDASVRRLKGPTRPVQALESRAAVMSGLKGVDMVVAFEEDTPLELIRALAPDILVKGADYREDQVVGGDLVKSWGGRIVLAGLTEGQSTTALVARAKS